MAAFSYDQIADYLVNGFWVDRGSSPHSWATTNIRVDISGLQAADQAFAQLAFQLWADLTPLNFTFATNAPHITVDDTQEGASASASWFSTGDMISAHINVSPSWGGGVGTSLYSHRFQTFLHEIGHALGLGHGGNYDGSASFPQDAHYDNDSWQASVMSYFDQTENTDVNGSFAFVLTPQIADIIAIQSMYGANTATRSGNTIYGVGNNTGLPVFGTNFSEFAFPSITIYDRGGIDTLDYSGTSLNQVINLRPEGMSSIYGETNNVMIARGTIIENAVSGSGNDRLIGNSANNVLNGGAGIDTAVFQGSLSQYTFQRIDSNSFRVIDKVAGRDGTDTLISIEQVQFSDQTVASTNLPFGIFSLPSFKLAAFGTKAGNWANNDLYPRQVADVNNDGMADIIGFGQAGVYISLATGGGSFTAPSLKLAAFGTKAGGWASNDLYPRQVADVNGDGFADIIGFSLNGVVVSLGNGDGTFGAPSLKLASFGRNAGGWSSNDLYPRLAADVNDDGMADVVGFGQSGVWVALATGGGNFAAPSLKLKAFAPGAGNWSGNDLYPRLLADVNGDGLADILGFGAAGVYVSLATGGGNFAAPSFKLAAFGTKAGGWASEDLYPRRVADVNNDGFADIIGFGQTGVWVSEGNGDGTFGLLSFELAAYGPRAGGWASNDLYPRQVADITGDQMADIVGFGQAGVYTSLAMDFVA